MSPIWPDDGWFPDGRHEPQPEPDGSGWARDWLADEVVDAESFLSRHVADAMNLDPEVRGGEMIVTVQNGVVILEGHADTAETRSAAVRRAWATPGVFDVCNMLAVGRDGMAS